jgi:hypothetical protein
MSVSASRLRAHAEIARMLMACVEPPTSQVMADGLPEPGPVPSKKLRFAVGDMVLCHRMTWEQAVVVKHWYREPNWPTGK